MKALAESAGPAPINFLNNLVTKSQDHCAVIAPWIPSSFDAAPRELEKSTAASFVNTLPQAGGALRDLEKACALSSQPIMRWDLIIDEYQIYESRVAGASSLALDMRAHDLAAAQYFIEIAREVGLEPVLVCYSPVDAVHAKATDADIIFVTCHNLPAIRQSNDPHWLLFDALQELAHKRVIGLCGSPVAGSRNPLHAALLDWPTKEIEFARTLGYKAILATEPMSSR